MSGRVCKAIHVLPDMFPPPPFALMNMTLTKRIGTLTSRINNLLGEDEIRDRQIHAHLEGQSASEDAQDRGRSCEISVASDNREDLNGGLEFVVEYTSVDDSRADDLHWGTYTTSIASSFDQSTDADGNPLAVMVLYSEDDAEFRVPFDVPTPQIRKWIATIADECYAYDGGVSFPPRTFTYPNTMATTNQVNNTVPTRAKQYIQRAVDELGKAVTQTSGDARLLASIDFASQLLQEAKSAIGQAPGKLATTMRKAMVTLQRTANILWDKHFPLVRVVENARCLESLTDNAVIRPVKSSALSRIAYEHADRTLMVEFKSGRQYAYYDVPRTVWDAFCHAPSKGRFYNSDIKDNYNSDLMFTPVRSLTTSEGDSLTSSQLKRTENQDKAGREAMRAGEKYDPPVTDGLEITKNVSGAKRYYRIRNYRKVQHRDGTMEVVIDSHGMKPIDGKELAAVMAQVAEQSTGPAAAIKATDIKHLDAASPVTEIVEFPEPNVHMVPGPEMFVGVPHSSFAEIAGNPPPLEYGFETAEIVAGTHASTTPENTSLPQYEEVVMATNRRTTNAVITDMLEAFHTQTTVSDQQELENMLAFSNLAADPFKTLQLAMSDQQ